jgi:hypothetical protein
MIEQAQKEWKMRWSAQRIKRALYSASPRRTNEDESWNGDE